MKRYTVMILSLVLCLCLLSGCGCEHEWAEANCVTPKTCSLCEETEGAPLGHVWAAANCDTAQTCTVCSETNGEPLGHTWTDADCENPKTCSVCRAAEGEALGHTEVTELVSSDLLNATGTHNVICGTCQKFLRTETIELTTLHADGYFLFSPAEYTQRVIHIMEAETDHYAELYVNTDMNNAISCDMWSLVSGNDYFAYSFFYDGQYELLDTDSDTRSSFNELWTIMDCVSTSEEDVLDSITTMAVIILAVDPTLDMDSGSDILVDLLSNGSAEVNGISYTLEVYNEDTAELLMTACVSG